MDSEGTVQNARNRATNRENQNFSSAKENEGTPRRPCRVDRAHLCSDLYFDDLILHGVPDQLADGVQFQLSHDVCTVGLGSLHTDI